MKHKIDIWNACKPAMTAVVLALSSATVYAQTWQFDFGTASSPVEPGYTQVTASTAYSAATGYGWGTVDMLDANATYTGTHYAYPSHVVDGDRGAPDNLREDFCANTNGPIAFLLDLPYGNYQVTLVSGDNDQATDATLSDTRRWSRVISTTSGSFHEANVTLNVHSGQLQLVLDSEDNGESGRFNALTVTKVDTPTIFIAGDSTVTDQREWPWAGWGQAMPLYFNSNIAIANYADSGETALSFWNAFYPQFKNVMQTNDYLFIQFGHNDQKNYDTTAYKNYLSWYIDDARSRGVIPVLITPVERNIWSGSTLTYSLGGYPDAMRALAAEKNVDLIDLNQMSHDYFQSIGSTATRTIFNYAGGYSDNTHFQKNGGLVVANMVVQGIKTAGLPIESDIVGGTLPVPWQSGDVGTVVTEGSVNEASGAFNVSGSGAGIGGTMDAFRYVYQALADDCEIQAKLTSADAGSQAGVMMRESLNADAANVFAFVSDGVLGLQTRSTSGGSTITNATATATLPCWLRLVRNGSSYIASVSTNGTIFTVFGTADISMTSTSYVGMAVSSRSAALASATFENVAANAPPILGNLVWRGDGVSNTWDMGSTTNWYSGTDAVPFYDGNLVAFNDTGDNSMPVNLAGTLQPFSVTFNASKNYEFGGSGSLEGSTLLTKNGSGTLTLSGTNGYTGATTVNSGDLRIEGSLAASPVAVNGGALEGSGSLGGNVTVGSGGVLSPGNGTGNAGTLRMAGSTTLSNAVLSVDLASAATAGSGINDLIDLDGGSLVLEGTNTVQMSFLDDYLANGTYTLISGGGSLTVEASNLQLDVPSNTRQTFGLNIAAPGTVTLDVGGNGASLVWNGNVNSTWDLNTTANWLDGAAAQTFYNLDAVTFNDSSSQGSVVVSGTVEPLRMTVTNSTQNYTISGGTIGGHTELMKAGNGTLTLGGTNNTYSGGTIIDGGTLALGSPAANSGALGSGAVTLRNGGTLQFHNYGNLTADGGNSNDIIVPVGETGNLQIPSRFGYGTLFDGRLLGGGTLNLQIDNIRGYYQGDWSQFSGQINISPRTTTVTNEFRIDNTYGYANAAIDLNDDVLMDTVRADLTVDIGELSGSSGAQLGPGSSTAVNPTWRVGARNTDATFAGVIADAGSTKVIKVGNGTWTLTGNNTYSGGTTVEDEGTLQIGDGGTTGSIGTGDVLISAGILAFNRSDDITYAGNTSGGGIIDKLGAGKLTLTGTHTSIGITKVEDGTLAFSGSGSIPGTPSITISSGATLDVSGRTDGGMSLQDSQRLSGTGNVVGDITMESGSILSIGSEVGTLGLQGDLTLNTGSSTIIKISKSPLSNDLFDVTGSIQYGGSLLVSQADAAALAAGDTFQIFQAASYGGTFSDITLPALSAGLEWDTTKLDVDGTVTVRDTATAPDSPFRLSAVALSSQIDLSWSASFGADSYTVKRSTTQGGPYSTIVGSGITATAFNDTTVTAGTTYYYVVTATNTYGESARSAEVSATPGSAPTLAIGLANSTNVNYLGGSVTSHTWSNFAMNGGNALAVVLTFETTSGVGNYTITYGTQQLSLGVSENTTAQATAIYYLLNVDTNAVADLTITTSSSDGFAASAVSLSNVGPIGVSDSDYATTGTYVLTLNYTAGAGDYAVLGAMDNSYKYYDSSVPNPSISGDNTPFTQLLMVNGASNGDGGSAHWAGPIASAGTFTDSITVDGVGSDVSSRHSAALLTFQAGVAPLPNAPSVTATAVSASQINLSWAASAGATGYTIQRATTSGGPYSTIASNLTATTYSDTGLAGLTTYYYVVSAVNASGESSSPEASATTPDSSGPDTTPPAAPTGLAATPGDGLVALDWVDNSEGDLAGYTVYRSTTGGYSAIASNLTVSAYTDLSAVNGTTYHYVVTATDTNNNESANSAQASATPAAPDTTPPAIPAELSATAGDSSVALDWVDNSEPDLASYTVYRSPTRGSGFSAIASNLVSSAYTDNSAVNGTTYYYVVTAVDSAANESGDSADAAATPAVLPSAGISLVTSDSQYGTTAGNGVTNSFDMGAGNDLVIALAYRTSGATYSGATVKFAGQSPSQVYFRGLGGGGYPDRTSAMIFVFTDLATTSGNLEIALDNPGTWGYTAFSLNNVDPNNPVYDSHDFYASSGHGPTTLSYNGLAGGYMIGVLDDEDYLGTTQPLTGDNLDVNPLNVVGNAANGYSGRFTAGGAIATNGTYSLNFPSYTYGAMGQMVSLQAAAGGGSTPEPAPAPPTNLAATVATNQIDLAWTASSNAVSYNVKRATGSGGSYATIVTNVTGTSYADTGLDEGTTYYYVVGAVNTAGEINSSAVSATTQYATMPEIGVSINGDNLTLNWPSNYTGWTLQYSTNLLSTNSWTTVPATALTNAFGFGTVSNNALFFRLVYP